jgi:hypothetical protein
VAAAAGAEVVDLGAGHAPQEVQGGGQADRRALAAEALHQGSLRAARPTRGRGAQGRKKPGPGRDCS